MTPQGADATRRRALRAWRRLHEPGARLVREGETYAVRTGHDRRRGARLRLDAAGFDWLAAAGALALAPEGWRLARTAPPLGPVPQTPTAPTTDAGAPPRRRARALDWLASRRDREGRPWLSPRHLAAAERLEADQALASAGAPLTGRLDGSPRAPTRVNVAEAAMAPALGARKRVRDALAGLDPDDARLLALVCLEGLGLAQAARRLGLDPDRMRGRLVALLDQLARHYGL